jgi:5-methylcytosine-specific restriction enzyme A
MKLQRLTPRLQTLRTPLAAPAAVERMRGRRAVDRRARWLYLHPLCVECDKEGRVTAATVPDHVVPLWKGGPDDESNLQSLCKAHHDVKSAAEAIERARGCA